MKMGLLAGRPVQAWPEYEECVARARKFRVPLKEVQQAALAAHRTRGRVRGAKR